MNNPVVLLEIQNDVSNNDIKLLILNLPVLITTIIRVIIIKNPHNAFINIINCFSNIVPFPINL